ncbi:hypothetical protein CLAIMM_11260 [Cladophialophora immunda]|nr:hypothetical protein CLAIMM_11260 [Cladophialophora immunda]
MMTEHTHVQHSEHVECPHAMGTDEVPLDLDDPHRAALEDNPAHAGRPPLKTLLAVVFLALSYVCPISCGFFLISAILIPVGTELHDTENVAWVVSGWSIASSVSFSMAGKLSDIFGRRWTILVGEVICLVGCIVACTANRTLILAAGSTIVGFGCGIVFVSYAGIVELLPNKWRGFGIGLTEVCICVPWCATSVLIANGLNSHTAAGWRWCYYIGVIYGTISLLGTFAFYYPPERPQHDFEKSRWQEVREIDFVGCILYTGGLTTFLVGISWAGSSTHPWKSVSTITPIVVGFLVLVLCFVYDFTLAKAPFFPLPLLRKLSEFTVLLVLVFVAGMVFYSMSALLPQGSLYMFTNDPTEIGIIALPSGIAETLFGAFATLFMGHIGHLKVQVIVLLSIQTVATGCYATVIPYNRSGWMALQFFGMGAFQLTTSIAYVIAGLNVPLRHLGLASGLIGTFRSAGGSVGNAVFSTILNSVVNEQLPKRIAAAALSRGYDPENLALLIPATVNNALGVPDAFHGVPDMDLVLQVAVGNAFREAYAAGFRRVFWATIPFGVIAVICAFFIEDPSRYLTNHTAVHMQGDEGGKRIAAQPPRYEVTSDKEIARGEEMECASQRGTDTGVNRDNDRHADT